jgi:hypothetical protein
VYFDGIREQAAEDPPQPQHIADRHPARSSGPADQLDLLAFGGSGIELGHVLHEPAHLERLDTRSILPASIFESSRMALMIASRPGGGRTSRQAALALVEVRAASSSAMPSTPLACGFVAHVGEEALLARVMVSAA